MNLSAINNSSVNNYANNQVASVLSSGLQSATSSGVSAVNGQDSSQLSPFAQLLSMLQHLQQSNPAQYQQVTQQIAKNLTTAAATATKDGNTAEATQLSTLAKDFTTASASGQLPNVQDLATAIGGGHHHHAHASSGDSAASSSANQTLQQLLASFQSGSSQNSSTNPLSIIMSTLSSAGISA